MTAAVVSLLVAATATTVRYNVQGRGGRREAVRDGDGPWATPVCWTVHVRCGCGRGGRYDLELHEQRNVK